MGDGWWDGRSAVAGALRRRPARRRVPDAAAWPEPRRPCPAPAHRRPSLPLPAVLPLPRLQYFRSPAQLLVHDRPTADPLVMSSGLGLGATSDGDSGAAAPASNGHYHAAGNGAGAGNGSGASYSGTALEQQAQRRAPGAAKRVRPPY